MLLSDFSSFVVQFYHYMWEFFVFYVTDIGYDKGIIEGQSLSGYYLRRKDTFVD